MAVNTKKGKIEGIDCGTYAKYLGIPYAAPPVGAYRWKAPVDLPPWEGVYEAKRFKYRCMQETQQMPPWDKDFYDDSEFLPEMSEDCLYLNIWVPKDTENKKRPVAFWIHGGAFMGGYASEKEFDGKAYCERGVILVTVEYRCNVFGYLAHPWLSGESPEHISGNYGTLDQIAALKWVYENIGAFGGDADNITVFGQSAGAMSVQTLVSSKLTGTMIARAIMQSGGSYGGGLHRDILLSEQEEYGRIFADMLGAGSAADMRERSAEEIMKILPEFLGRVMPVAKGLFLTPTIDGKVLDGTCYGLMDQGRIKDIPYLLGTTKDDILVTPKMREEHTFSELYCGSVDFSLKLEELGRKPAYVYYFTRDLPGDRLGAWHSSELWYMFGTLDRCWRPWEERDYELSGRMLDYWTNFMKTGDPNGDGLEPWNACSREHPEVFCLE